VTSTSNTTTSAFDDAIRAAFLKDLPEMKAKARLAFHKIVCQATREDLEAETLALAWKSYVGLCQVGKQPEKFLNALMVRCTQAVKAGRRLTGSENTRDVLSPLARVRHGFIVVSLGDRQSVAEGQMAARMR
jgi:hypothetical protein